MLVIILVVFVTLVRATDYHDKCELRPWLERCQSEEVESDLTDDRVHTNDLIWDQEAKMPLSTLPSVRPKSRVSQGDNSQMILFRKNSFVRRQSTRVQPTDVRVCTTVCPNLKYP